MESVSRREAGKNPVAEKADIRLANHPPTEVLGPDVFCESTCDLEGYENYRQTPVASTTGAAAIPAYGLR
jgi:hypothetical protein